MRRAGYRALRSALAGVAMGSMAMLAACGGDDNGSGQPTPPPGQTSSIGFEPYLQQLVQQSSCDTAAPVTTANVSFVFAADQDTAEPRDLSKIMPGCTK